VPVVLQDEMKQSVAVEQDVPATETSSTTAETAAKSDARLQTSSEVIEETTE